jgi:hypothetical protein
MTIKKHSWYEHTPFIWEYDSVVSNETCNTILSLIQQSPAHDEYLTSNTIRSKVRNNSCINVSQVGREDESMAYADKMIHAIFSDVHAHYVLNNKRYFTLKNAQYLYTTSCSYTYRTYDKSDYYDWHIDSSDHAHLLFSYILYLNDDFSGGDTLFLNQKLKVKPKKGSMLCFPCDMQTVHKSTAIKEGKKNIIWTCMEYHAK